MMQVSDGRMLDLPWNGLWVFSFSQIANYHPVKASLSCSLCGPSYSQKSSSSPFGVRFIVASSSLREAVLVGSAQPFDFPVEYRLTADQVREDSVGSAQYS